MRKTLSIVRETALEVLSEPLTLLVMLAALALAVLTPTFHCHQFGEVTRMARDAGFSAMLTGGGVLAVFGTIRAFRREIESGTLEMALSRPISPSGFFLSKVAGAFVATLLVVMTVFAAALTMVGGAATGGRVSEASGDIARLWGPSVAAAAGIVVLPLTFGAAANRFGRMRFVLSSVLTAVLLGVGCAVWTSFREGGTLMPLYAGALPLAALLALLTAAAAAFAMRFQAHAAAALSGLVVAGLLPFVGNYYLADALANGGRVTWGYVGLTFVVTLPAVAAFLIWGASARRDE